MEERMDVMREMILGLEHMAANPIVVDNEETMVVEGSESGKELEVEENEVVLGSVILPPSRIPEWNPRTLYVVHTYLSFVSGRFPPRFRTYPSCTVHHLISPSSLPCTC